MSKQAVTEPVSTLSGLIAQLEANQPDILAPTLQRNKGSMEVMAALPMVGGKSDVVGEEFVFDLEQISGAVKRMKVADPSGSDAFQEFLSKHGALVRSHLHLDDCKPGRQTLQLYIQNGDVRGDMRKFHELIKKVTFKGSDIDYMGCVESFGSEVRFTCDIICKKPHGAHHPEVWIWQPTTCYEKESVFKSGTTDDIRPGDMIIPQLVWECVQESTGQKQLGKPALKKIKLRLARAIVYKQKYNTEIARALEVNKKRTDAFLGDSDSDGVSEAEAEAEAGTPVYAGSAAGSKKKRKLAAKLAVSDDSE